MCTVSWLHEGSGYQLFCNRDEKRTRRPALPPRVGCRDGMRFLAPVDGDFGGTWIAINELGLSFCLLNGPPLYQSGPRSTSRGLLLPELINTTSIDHACTRLSGADLSPFAPFTLAVLEPGRSTAIVEWNGIEQRIVRAGQSSLPLTSSSFDPDAVRRARQQEYVRCNGSHLEFHKSHESGPSAYSTCMHRPDAETVSFSWVRVARSEATFSYSPAAPCKGLPAATTTLKLRQ